jgi:hypothetical protein
MKNKLNVIFVILVAFVLVPQIALASWWNPFSWFKKNPQPVEQPIAQIQPTNIPVVVDTKITTPRVNDVEKITTKKVNIPVVSPIVNTPIQAVIDVCKNIEGVQTLIPTGMSLNGGNCIVASVPTPQQPQIATDKALNPSVNYDQQLSQLIAQGKQNISVFQSAVKETKDFAPTVQATMNKYPNEIIIQQSGQDLLNENTNLASISNKLVSIETDQINKLSSHLSLGTLPTVADISQFAQQYNDYYAQYQTSNTKITSLIKTFVSNQKTVLDRLIQENTQKLDETKQKVDDQKNANQAKQEKLNAINLQIANLNAKYAEDVATARKRQSSMAQINLHIQVLTDQYNIDYATLKAEYQQIVYGN